MRKRISASQVRLKPLRAYISAPAEIDTAVLRRLLSAENVTVDDAYSLDVGEPLAQTILKRVRSADFAVAVIAQGAWTVYDVGLCDSLGKPVLILAGSDVQLPAFLAIHQHLRSELADTDLLRLTLRRFVEEVRSGASRLISRKQRTGKATRGSSKVRGLLAAIRDARAGGDPRRIEQLAQDLLRSAAVTAVAQEPMGGDRGVDFAVWADGLAQVVGNPLVVEVKAGHLSRDSLKEAELQLAEAMRSAGARLGLLLYLDREGHRFDQPRWETPYVLRFDLEDLARALARRTFANVVVEQRNRLVHGIG